MKTTNTSQPIAPLDLAQFEGLLTCDGMGKEAKRAILGQLLSELQQLRKEAAIDLERATHYRNEWQKAVAQRDALAGALQSAEVTLSNLLNDAKAGVRFGPYAVEGLTMATNSARAALATLEPRQ